MRYLEVVFYVPPSVLRPMTILIVPRISRLAPKHKIETRVQQPQMIFLTSVSG